MRSCTGAVVLALMVRCLGLCLCAGEALRKNSSGASHSGTPTGLAHGSGVWWQVRPDHVIFYQC